MVTTWAGDRYVLGFAPTLRFLRSQILCRLRKSLDEAVNETDSIDWDQTDVGHTTNQTNRDISLQITHSEQKTEPEAAL